MSGSTGASPKFFLALLGIGLAVIAVVLLWSMALGWLLTRIFGFSLFEGALLAMFATFCMMYVMSNVARALDPDSSFLSNDPDDLFETLGFDIPASRFYKTEAEKTGEAWLRYELANVIHVDLKGSPITRGSMDKQQLQELAIRLADVGVALAKGKSSKAKRLRVTKPELTSQMLKMGLKPYDDDIMSEATGAINMALTMPPVENLIRSKNWDKHTDLFEVVD